MYTVRLISGLIFIALGFISSGQDVVVSVTGRYLGNPIPLDTLVIEDITNPGQLVFGPLPQSITTYIIDLSSGILVNGIEENSTDEGITLIINQPGYVQIGIVSLAHEVFAFSLYNSLGVCFFHENTTCGPGSNLFEIETGKEGFNILCVTSQSRKACFKVTGCETKTSGAQLRTAGQFISAGSGEKGSMRKYGKGDGFHYSPGDKVRFTAKKSGMYPNTEPCYPNNGDSIFIALSSPCQGIPVVQDYDGNVYHTVQIDDRCWMRENMRVIHYSDGSPLTDGTGVGSIGGDYTTKYWFDYNDDPSLSPIYGKLYSGAGVLNGASGIGADSINYQGICPTGWHVSSDEDWLKMEEFLGMDSWSLGLMMKWRGTDQGNKIKETDSIHWGSYNYYSTNESWIHSSSERLPNL